MKRIISSLLLAAFMVISIFSISCKCKNDDNLNVQIDSDSINLQQKMEEAKEIFYSLPAPHEVASVLMVNGASKFNADLLNPTNNSSKYTTEVSQALNLGVYSADLSYASLFEQNQIVINYMATSKKLAEQLRILEAFDQKTIDELEKNINNRDEIMRIISESFMNSDAYLQENNRQDIGAMILIGGWVEGLYLAVAISEGKVNNNEALTSSILEQQLSLELTVKFLEDFDSDKLNIVKKDLMDLYDFYGKIDPTVTDDGFLQCSQEDFKKLCDMIIGIRTKIINLS